MDPEKQAKNPPRWSQENHDTLSGSGGLPRQLLRDDEPAMTRLPVEPAVHPLVVRAGVNEMGQPIDENGKVLE